MTEDEARTDLHQRGVWQMAPGLWCDASVPDMISVVPELDTAVDVRRALLAAGQLPGKHSAIGGISMSEQERKVWDAIENVLRTVGDADIQAGLAWITDDGKQQVVQAAIVAAQEKS